WFLRNCRSKSFIWDQSSSLVCFISSKHWPQAYPAPTLLPCLHRLGFDVAILIMASCSSVITLFLCLIVDRPSCGLLCSHNRDMQTGPRHRRGRPCKGRRRYDISLLFHSSFISFALVFRKGVAIPTHPIPHPDAVLSAATTFRQLLL